MFHPTVESLRETIEESPHKYNHIYHVLDAADFVHTLVVEGVVHHLDLTLEVPTRELPADAYALVIEVLTGLLGSELPSAWSPEEAVLKGTGRLALTSADRAKLGARAEQFPLFG